MTYLGTELRHCGDLPTSVNERRSAKNGNHVDRHAPPLEIQSSNPIVLSAKPNQRLSGAGVLIHQLRETQKVG